MGLQKIIVAASTAALAFGVAGCATQPAPQAAAPAQLQPTSYRPVAAAALAFDPPMTRDQPLPDMSRDGRSPSAFMGYEESVTTVSSVYQRDEIRADHGDFDRRAYTGRTSVTSR